MFLQIFVLDAVSAVPHASKHEEKKENAPPVKDPNDTAIQFATDVLTYLYSFPLTEEGLGKLAVRSSRLKDEECNVGVNPDENRLRTADIATMAIQAIMHHQFVIYYKSAENDEEYKRHKRIADKKTSELRDKVYPHDSIDTHIANYSINQWS